MQDSRQRNSRHLMTANTPTLIDWASEKQREIFGYGPAPICASGAYNCGKTIVIVLKMLYIADLFPGYRWLVARNVWDDIRKTTMPSFFKFCPRNAYEPNGRRSDTEKILELNNGSSFIWMHLDEAESISSLNGLELNGFFFNQSEDIAEEKFTTALNRLNRWDKVTVPQHVVDAYTVSTGKGWPYVNPKTGRLMPPAYAMIDCNPRGYGHWIYEMFHVDGARHGERNIRFEEDKVMPGGWILKAGEPASYKELGYRMWEMATYENKYATKQSLEQAQTMDEAWKRTYYHGKWGIHEGQIHNVRAESQLEPTPMALNHVQNRCTLHRSFDHGDSAPACCLWWGVDEDGNVFGYREYYKGDTLISEHRRAITRLSDGEQYQFNIADPSIFAHKVQNAEESMTVEFLYRSSQNGFDPETRIFWQKGDNDELGTRDRISEYLRPQGTGVKWESPEPPKIPAEHLKIFNDPGECPPLHPITKELGYWPRRFFIKATSDYPNGCKQAIFQMRSQSRLKVGTINGKTMFSDDRDEAVTDHAYDAVRYFMASRPSRFRARPRSSSRKSFESVRRRMLEARSKGHRNRVAALARQHSRTANV